VFNTEGHPFEIEKPNADLSGCKSDKKGSPTFKLPTHTRKGPAFPFLSNFPGIGDFQAPRLLKNILGGMESAVQKAGLLEKRKEYKASAHGHGKLAKQRKFQVVN